MDTPQNIARSEIHNFLVRRLGEKEAEEIMAYIDSEVEKEAAVNIDATKQEITLWREEMKNVFATKDDANTLQKKLTKRVSSAEGTLIMWGFVFWITVILAVFIIFKFVENH
ncbi:MAG: hypothetical protein ABIO82_08220 [Ginsengibacter sp.]